MRVGGGLRYVTGPMGAGKSLYGVRAIVKRLAAGQYVVTNVRLLDDAPQRIAQHFARKGDKRSVVESKVRRFYVYETDLAAAMRYRLPGTGESRALFVWDEAHNDLNNRNYRDRDQSLLEWATQLRKLGFEGVLLSQSHENTDAQLRRVCNFLVRLQNQRESTRLLGMRMRFLPPLFLAHWYMTNVPAVAGRVQTPVKVERYMLGYYRHLYDTLELYHGVTDAALGEGATVLLPEGGRASSEGVPAPRDSAEGAPQLGVVTP